MKTIAQFIKEIDNKTWNRIRNSKSDADARRILYELNIIFQIQNNESK